jgi:DNA replication and repair protein RecF
LDRLVLAVEPAHARHSSRYDRAVRQRNKLLTDDRPADPEWLDGLEKAMAESAVLINISRNRLLAQLGERLAAAPDGPFAVPAISLDSEAIQDEEQLRGLWKQARARDRGAGRTLLGPHRADIIVEHVAKRQAAALCSTGEQKALLLSTILAHAGLVAEMRAEAPIILLDEVAAHLDPSRRQALFERLAATGSQVWMTGTEAGLFDGIGAGAQLIEVEQGHLTV